MKSKDLCKPRGPFRFKSVVPNRKPRADTPLGIRGLSLVMACVAYFEQHWQQSETSMRGVQAGAICVSSQKSYPRMDKSFLNHTDHIVKI